MNTPKTRWSARWDQSRPGDGWDHLVPIEALSNEHVRELCDNLEARGVEYLMSFSLYSRAVLGFGELKNTQGHFRFKDPEEAVLFRCQL